MFIARRNSALASAALQVGILDALGNGWLILGRWRTQRQRNFGQLRLRLRTPDTSLDALGTDYDAPHLHRIRCFRRGSAGRVRDDADVLEGGVQTGRCNTRPSAPLACSKASKAAAALLKGRLAATGGRYTINRIRSTPTGKSRTRMRCLRSRRGASFAWLANQVTIGSRSIFQLPCCFHRRRSWSSHPAPERNC